MSSGLALSKKVFSKITQSRQKGAWRGTPNRRSWWRYIVNFAKINSEGVEKWNILLPVFLYVVIFTSLFVQLTTLQVVGGEKYWKESQINHFRPITVMPYRGVIFDKNGQPLTKNVVSKDLYLDLDSLRTETNEIPDEKINNIGNKLELLLGTDWAKYVNNKDQEFHSIAQKIYSFLDKNPYANVMLLANNIDEKLTLKITSSTDQLEGVYLTDGYKRFYPDSKVFAPIIGYTGIVYAEDLQALDYVGFNDIIGKTGLEKIYDRELIGEKGMRLVEVDAFGKRLSDDYIETKAPVSGKSLYLTIDADAQKKAYDLLKDGVRKYKASSGAMVVEDVNTGEILVMASYPSYDSNKFIEGITQKDYEALLNQKGAPLSNKAISAQAPPGSTFKTLVALSALDAKAITTSTVYVSSSRYTLSNGRHFQEFHNHSYGPLTVRDALMVSSNIFFCETIRHWDIDKLDEYLERFRVGQPTGIDLPGEMPGRLPSPANKIMLAKTTSPWLDPIWYPEGDACNSVIGQGITLVTPIQAANWAAMIANGGTLQHPHLAKKFITVDGSSKSLKFEPYAHNVVNKSAIKVVQDGMRASVAGSRRVIVPLTSAKAHVAAKTGTAEFGKVDKNGIYEHTHAWVLGFWPYEKPKYSFVVFLEDGGASNNAAAVMREFIDWWE